MRPFIAELERFGPRCLAVAHRGARAFAPENTLAAFAKAIDLACAMVELDVHSTRDGQVVVHHDDDLRRCTNVADVFPDRSPFRLADFDQDELARLDAGRWSIDEWARPAPMRQPFLRSLTTAERALVDAADSPIAVPTLTDVLALAARTGLRLNIELKPTLADDPLLADRTLTAVHAAGLRDKVLISSFDLPQIERIRGLSNEVAIAWLTDSSPPDLLGTMARIDADALNPNCDDTRCVDDLRTARSAGHAAFPWTCNDPAAMRTLIDAGATGIITDYPNRMPTIDAR